MENNDKDTEYSYFKNFINGVEGNSPDAYDDSNGNSTVGTGLNLQDPLTRGVMVSKGINPAAVSSGDRSIASDENDDVVKGIYDAKRGELDNLKNNYFPGANLNPAQNASLMSLMYNNPALVGPQLRQKLNDNDTPGVIKELLLNSNKDSDPGILKRRIKEAELYGGPVDFNMTTKSLSPDELSQIRSTMGKMQNGSELQSVKNQYKFLDHDQDNQPDPVTFYKAKKLFGD